MWYIYLNLQNKTDSEDDDKFDVDKSESIDILPDNAPDKKWKGIAFIVYNTYRNNQTQKDLPDTKKDGRKMGKFFKDVNYYTVSGRNLTYREFMDTCKYLVTYSHYPPSCRRIVVYFAGHGNEESITMEGGKSVKIRDVQALLRKFQSDKKVAKILLIDACRDSITGIAKLCDLWCRFWYCFWCIITLHHKNESKSSNDNNELLAYATTENHGAYSLEYGGLWTQTLIKQLYELQDKHIKEILKQIYITMGKKEVPGFQGYYQHPISHDNLEEDIFFWKEASMFSNCW